MGLYLVQTELPDRPSFIAKRCPRTAAAVGGFARLSHDYHCFSCSVFQPADDNQHRPLYALFERSEFLIDTSQKKNLSMCVCVRLILVLVWKKIVLVLVWGTYYVPYVPISRQKSHHVRIIAW